VRCLSKHLVIIALTDVCVCVVFSAAVLSREIDRKNPVEVREANKYMLADAAVALLVASALNFAVISCFAELFFNIGRTNSHLIAISSPCPSYQ
jgi:hypothetical protein